jgi:hypothetical protein
MLRLFDTNLKDGQAPSSTDLTKFDHSLPILIGRGSLEKPVDIKVALKRDGREVMSRQHCRLVYSSSENSWVVEDMGALNGVFVNYEKVTERKTLKHSDILQLGGIAGNIPNLKDVCIRFRFEHDSSSKRKRGASQNGANSLTALTPGTAVSPKARVDSGSNKGVSVEPTEDDVEMDKLRKDHKRVKKELKEKSGEVEELTEEVSNLKAKCSSLRKDNKAARDDKTKIVKDLQAKKEDMDELAEDLKQTTNELESTRETLASTEERLKILQPTGKSCIDNSALSSMLECPICSKPLLDAVVTACSHGFCRLCLETKIQNDVMKGNRCQCPVCKTNPMGSRTHLFYFRSKHLDDAVSLLVDACDKMKSDFLAREKHANAQMSELNLDIDARYGVIGVKMGAGSAIEQLAASGGGAKQAPSSSGQQQHSKSSSRSSSSEGYNADASVTDRGDETTSRAEKPPPRCGYCGVDDHDESSCPEQAENFSNSAH